MEKECTLDILLIDTNIRKKFEDDEKNLDNFIEEKENLEQILKRNEISVKVKTDIIKKLEILSKKIEDVSNGYSKNFYLMETSTLIEKYKEILAKPIIVTFSGRTKDTEAFKEKDEIIQKYLQISAKYTKESFVYYTNKKRKCNVVICENCNSKNCYETIDGKTYICEECGFSKEILGNLTSYKDVSRVNISSKYTYERRVHFRDCMNQYQGKQNSTIPEKVYQDLEKQFNLHGLLGNEELQREERFKNITKDHIQLFLKETGHTKHYEDVFLIYYKMTGKKPDDISHLENKLMEDFEILSDLYDKKFKQDKSKKIDRKSFINIQYVLYQLLRKYKHPCRKEDFNILKTLDRKSFHDDIMKELFEELNWNFFSPQF